jgi:hypothetical protein
MNNFIEWLENLELQTLTDELKSEIIERFESHYNSEDLYVRIGWPEVQNVMDEVWFNDEAILDTNTPADYLIPMTRIEQRYEEIKSK